MEVISLLQTPTHHWQFSPFKKVHSPHLGPGPLSGFVTNSALYRPHRSQPLPLPHTKSQITQMLSLSGTYHQIGQALPFRVPTKSARVTSAQEKVKKNANSISFLLSNPVAGKPLLTFVHSTGCLKSTFEKLIAWYHITNLHQHSFSSSSTSSSHLICLHSEDTMPPPPWFLPHIGGSAPLWCTPFYFSLPIIQVLLPTLHSTSTCASSFSGSIGEHAWNRLG